MNAERSGAYGRVVKTLADVGAAKLHADECRRIRAAADTLLFAIDHDTQSLDALADAERLASDLVASGRWTRERATKLADDVAACGPSPVIEAPALTEAA